ncbi:MAG: TetR/AcrR family transcriptional regulator [Candidatus Thorarchaeota archaeon]
MNNTYIKKKNKKKTRSRSPEKKAAQFEQFLDVGKRLFYEKGRDGFSLRKLANELNMNQNNIYNYVESKRELWIAIRNKLFYQYRNETIKILKNHRGSSVELITKMFEHFLEFAANDPAAFKMMYIDGSPTSEKIGKYEKEYEAYNYFDGTVKIFQKAINDGEILEKNPNILTFFMYCVGLGAAIVEFGLKYMEEHKDYKGTAADENVNFGNQPFTSKEFRNYVLQKIKLGLSDPNLIVNKSKYQNND